MKKIIDEAETLKNCVLIDTTFISSVGSPEDGLKFIQAREILYKIIFY